MRIVYIYVLIDPRNNKFRYLGKTRHLCKRYRAHLNDKGSTRKARWIQRLTSLSLQPNVIVLEVCSDTVWQARERYWITQYKEDLFNHTPGGEGVTEWEEESLEKLSNSLKKLYENEDFCRDQRRKITNNPERNKKISLALTGKPKSPEHVAKLPQNQKGYKHKLGFAEKISKAIKKRYRDGYVLPEATKEKLRRRMLGNKFGVGNTSGIGRKNSEESKRKVSESLKGRKFSKDTLQKMSEARYAYWRRRKERENEP